MLQNEINHGENKLSALHLLIVIFTPIFFHQLLWFIDAPYLFSRDDNLNYFLPLIKTHTQIALGFDIPRMIWGLGAGWDPFNSGQAGLFYPVYWLAYLLSTLFNAPFALLEISMVLHQIILGLLVMKWSLGAPKNKLLLALALMFLPGPFLLGMNWHNYGTGHIWWIALFLLFHQQMKTESFFRCPWKKLLLGVLVGLFYMAAHPQMFIWGIFFGGCAVLLMAPQHQWRRCFLLLGLCLLPILPSMLYLREIALQSANLVGRLNNPDEILDLAQPLHLPLLGSVTGNMFSWLQMKIWDLTSIETQAPGLYFQPMIWVCLWLSVLKRRWILLGLVLFTFVVLGNETFSWVTFFMQGPFKGFHWTFKLVVFTAPFFLLLAYFEYEESAGHWFSWGLFTLALLSATICFQGRHFDLMTETQEQHHLGAKEILLHTQNCLEEANIPTGARLAFVGDYRPTTQQPPEILPLIGNGLLLLDRNALHLYEPMDTNQTAQGRLFLSGRYGYKIKNQNFMENQEKHLEAFRYLGVTHLFSLNKKLFDPEKLSFCQTLSAQKIYFQSLENPRNGSFPQAQTNESILIEKNGNLRAHSKGQEPPALNTIHPIAWDKTSSGWVGTPNPLHPLWSLSVVLLALLACLLFWRIP